MEEIIQSVTRQAQLAKTASRQLALASTELKNQALYEIGRQLEQDSAAILEANDLDYQEAVKSGSSPSYLDRLLLTPSRIKALIQSLVDLASLPDPIGEITAEWTRPNGLLIREVRVPLGVIGMVYEARPNVTLDAAAIAIKTGNAICLRGSRSSMNSNQAITESIRKGLQAVGLPPGAVQYLTAWQRESVDVLCTLNGLIDVIIPRGGADLINRVVKTSTVPVLETGVGICHILIDRSAPYEIAEKIVHNAKISRPSVCNAVETILIHQDWDTNHTMRLLTSLHEANVALRACERTRQTTNHLPFLEPATSEDWDTEYLDLMLSVRTVADISEAIEHIAIHGTGHSESILTQDQEAADRFLNEIDAACVYHNASTRFTDGGEFGYGAEIGISTQKTHARGPMGLPALTSVKYKVYGQGQIR
ncbi:glutamate-5-semialdehyde dehydrogenase [Brevibacillus sp. SYSU BS000544]|uniref:glutamate-5-semialdehyde dehydrogenase n=1 Tax=Brevibacillus sp. SYSU BS000544 TaxID=3416443 RepID=UPI003CE55ACD